MEQRNCFYGNRICSHVPYTGALDYGIASTYISTAPSLAVFIDFASEFTHIALHF
ncbi:hypothetical protein SDC9_180946 [bioreactor metagenome]|uniref:Uncharacterized protein n=1 Tax=bioreactor metagenome TaxID=1076179 RepID=A0A645H355_9ZZZZ